MRKVKSRQIADDRQKRFAKKVTSIDAPWGDFWGELYGDYEATNKEGSVGGSFSRKNNKQSESSPPQTRYKAVLVILFILGVAS
jgi:hypothetical protein